MDAAVWFKRIKCLVLVCIFASIGNFISTSKAGNPVTPLEAVPGLVLLLLCTLVGCIIYELINKVSPKNLPGDRLYLIYCDPDHDPGCQPDRRLCDRTRLERSDFFRSALRSLHMPESPSEKMWIHLRNRALRS